MTGLLRLHRLFADEDRHCVPASLAAQVRHLALETWGEASAEERQRVDALVQAELALRAEALFELDPAAHARTRQHLDDVTRRLGSTPHHSHWRRWTAVWLSARARRARRHAAAAEGRQRAAAEWRERCGAAVMAMFDIEVARARRAAAHAAADRPRIINQKETPHVDLSIN